MSMRGCGAAYIGGRSDDTPSERIEDKGIDQGHGHDQEAHGGGQPGQGLRAVATDVPGATIAQQEGQAMMGAIITVAAVAVAIYLAWQLMEYLSRD